MRRFIEEIIVKDPVIAGKIIRALETKPADKDSDGGNSNIRCAEPEYEIDMYEKGYDPCRDDGKYRPGEHCCILKIFVREG